MSLGRKLAVLEELAAAQRRPAVRQLDGVTRDVVAEHAILMPPWRDRHPVTGELGPWYGPLTEAAFERQLQRHEDSIEGGGLWDFAEDVHEQALRRRLHAERQDAEDMIAFAATHWLVLPPREQQVFQAYYLEQHTIGVCAKRLGIAKASARSVLQSLRNRMSAYLRVANPGRAYG